MEVKLHDIGEGMHEAEILNYFVNKGDRVQNDAPLLEVQTDKMTAELTAPAEGIIEEIMFQPGDVIEVGTTILTLKTEKKEGERKSEGEPVQKRKSPIFRVKASPHTRRLAREHDVDIEKVEGSGKGGRIIDEDIFSYLENKEYDEHPKADRNAVSNTPVKEAEKGVETIPFRGRRKQIAKKMTQSLYTAPHVTHFDEVDMTELLNLTNHLKTGSDKMGGKKVSAAAFFIKALQLSLKQHPVFNSKLDEEQEEIKIEQTYNIGLATATEEGLIVPVLKHVESLSLLEIHQQMKTLTEKAQQNSLSADELNGGTFTISNVGPLGSTGATPILNFPEVGLMAFHKTKKRPVVVDDEIVIREMMNISLTFDHRVADGSQSVAFTNQFIEYIENPHYMFVEMT
ncbi:2-oxo acid dehydrogenase subunit E2 [Halobacillus yeomjeoni]|uniref:dihydrolipoamide acetyltransferase family protein n=1 Tax=Halobacillus yeomjeoni TaxID=311194 RepID=UPI001CD58AB0|nr:dihydrolipoamide acetyltransferase family protein [Halobacillus yeomjeoni]MCA0982981.1 2-oxo acid dehydrogenase subunit E2 [Halobacillus yeomjeoni]